MDRLSPLLLAALSLGCNHSTLQGGGAGLGNDDDDGPPNSITTGISPTGGDQDDPPPATSADESGSSSSASSSSGGDDPATTDGAEATSAGGSTSGLLDGSSSTSDAGQEGDPLHPSLDVPEDGDSCMTPGSLGECPFVEVCRFKTSEAGMCETCEPCGNLGAFCNASSECDILFSCFEGRCTNFCMLGEQGCGAPEDCLDVGHPTHGVCDPAAI